MLRTALLGVVIAGAAATPLAHGVRSFGMRVPNTDPAGSGLIADRRFRGQEGADDKAPRHSHLGVLGVTGFLMQYLSANPLGCVEAAGSCESAAPSPICLGTSALP